MDERRHGLAVVRNREETTGKNVPADICRSLS
jgi:hypothetical protein